MMRVFLILLMLAGNASAAVIFTGNRHFRNSELLKLVRTAGTMEQKKQAIDDAYLQEGFFSAQTGAAISADTVFAITEGRQSWSDDVSIVGVDTLIVRPPGLLADKTPVTAEFLQMLIRRIVGEYANAGYPFCQATLERIDVLGDRLRLEFQIATGPSTTFGKVEFGGLTATHPDRLRDRTRFPSGAPYRESLLERAKRGITQLDFTRLTREPLVTHNTRDNAADVRFMMRDERNVTIDGLLYLNSDNSLGGSGDLGLLNVFGTGERISLHWAQISKASKDLALGVTLPYAFRTPLDLQMTAAQSDRDSAYVSGRVALGASYHASERFRVGAVASWEKITPEEGQSSPSARIAGISLLTLYNSRDDVRLTRRGVFFTTELGSTYRKSFDGERAVSTGYATLLRASLESWLPVRGRWIVYQRLAPFQIRSDFSPIPAEQLIEVGGPGSLRGYRERSFLADQGLLSATELRYVFEAEFLARLFCDNAYIESQAGTRKLTGFGLGLELGTTLGKFRLDFSLGEEKQLDAMLVHFGFESGL